MKRVMQKSVLRIAGMAIACLAVLNGCLGPATVPPVETLLVNPELQVTPSAQRLPLTLGIRPLMAQQSLDKRVVRLSADQVLEFKNNEFWAEDPKSSVTRAILDALNGSEVFSDVGNAADMTRPDLILTGELRAYYEEETAEGLKVKAVVRLELRRARSKDLVWADTLMEIEPAGTNSGAAINRAMGKVVGRIASSAASAMAAACAGLGG